MHDEWHESRKAAHLMAAGKQRMKARARREMDTCRPCPQPPPLHNRPILTLNQLQDVHTLLTFHKLGLRLLQVGRDIPT